MEEISSYHLEAPEKGRDPTTLEQLSALQQDVDASIASVPDEVQERYQTLKQEMDELNRQRFSVTERLKSDGLLDDVEKNSANGWLLRTDFCVDFERVRRGIEPPTFYSNADVQDVSTLAEEDPERFQNGEEFISVAGKRLPKTVFALWDDVYDNKRTIDLNVDANGNASYRSYRHSWDLRELLSRFDQSHRKVNVPQLVAEEQESDLEKKFDMTNEVVIIDRTIDEETANAPPRWQSEAREINEWFEKQRRDFPDELKETVRWVLLDGVEVRAANDGTPLLVIRQEIGPVFRKYHDVLFGKRVTYKPLKKYRDGCYATSLGATKEDFMTTVHRQLNRETP